jgi:hypothetical protein
MFDVVHLRRESKPLAPSSSIMSKISPTPTEESSDASDHAAGHYHHEQTFTCGPTENPFTDCYEYSKYSAKEETGDVIALHAGTSAQNDLAMWTLKPEWIHRENKFR